MIMPRTDKHRLIYQFKITLKEIYPPIWRRIQVPANYSFWDLHVAIQDAMGWLDYHLHAFRIRQKYKSRMIEIGIPDDEFDEVVFLPGWEIPVREYFTEPGDTAEYEYDFGDGWEHEVLLEGILLKEKGTKYPRCIAGERACPPEDCGSVPGYYHLLGIIRDPTHEEYKETIAWLKGHAKSYYPYEPEEFHPDNVHFDNPKRRWQRAFSETGER
jgi:hypothetical protein